MGRARALIFFRFIRSIHKMLSLVASSPMAFAPVVSPVSSASRAMSSIKMVTTADLEALAKKCNPTVGFYDPLGLVKNAVAQGTETETIGWLRHAEIKHGRVAMAAFVGFIVQSNGIHFPWNLSGDVSFADISAAGGPGDQWDALPTYAKVQILSFIGFLELFSETTFFLEQAGEKHYVRGGKPGYFPPFSKCALPHPVPLDLFDPFGLTSKMTPERKEKALTAEINNGRFAQIGIIGFCAASKGLYVPGLDSIAGIKPYAGEYMAPFSATNADLPFVTDMLNFASTNLKFGNFVPDLY